MVVESLDDFAGSMKRRPVQPHQHAAQTADIVTPLQRRRPQRLRRHHRL